MGRKLIGFGDVVGLMVAGGSGEMVGFTKIGMSCAIWRIS